MGTGLGVPSLTHNVALGATTVTITPAAGFVIEAALGFFLGDGGAQHGGRRPRWQWLAASICPSGRSTVDAASGGNRRYGNCDRACERECACHAGQERAGLDASVCPSMPIGEFQYSAM
jgi:hypothetical protein